MNQGLESFHLKIIYILKRLELLYRYVRLQQLMHSTFHSWSYRVRDRYQQYDKLLLKQTIKYKIDYFAITGKVNQRHMETKNFFTSPCRMVIMGCKKAILRHGGLQGYSFIDPIYPII
jgi:hypothetical protein